MRKKPRILVVDDDENILNALSKLLKINENYSVKTLTGKKGLENTLKNIENFNPHILIQDLILPNFSGIDVLKAVKHKKYLMKIIFSGMGDASFAKKAIKYGAFVCVSKPLAISALINDPQEGIKAALLKLANLKKKNYLKKLTKASGIKPLVCTWKNKSDAKMRSGSEVIYTNIGELDSVRTIGLYLPHTKIKHGSCLSIAYGCVFNCVICKTGTEEEYKRQYSTSEIIAMQELVMRTCLYYDSYFWLQDIPFFIAVMGEGDIVSNFEPTIKAMEAIHAVFGDRFICNVSTAHEKGIQKLIAYYNNDPKITPNLQISLHGVDVETRKKLINSNDEPKNLYKKGLDYAKLTGTKLTVNYCLTNINSSSKEIRELASWINHNFVRIKFSLIIPSNKATEMGIKAAEKVQFKIAAKIAKKHKVEYELFDERRMKGVETGAACGNVINKIQ